MEGEERLTPFSQEDGEHIFRIIKIIQNNPTSFDVRAGDNVLEYVADKIEEAARKPGTPLLFS